MKKCKSDWYKTIWSLDIKEQSWVEDTKHQVDFLIKEMNLTGNERILDLACGFGRHSLEFARRGFKVVGVDITYDFIQDAMENAKKDNLPAEFICSDIRELSFDNEFDCVINMADGAIGYLENDEENEKIFDCVAKALKPGGKHFMDIMSADYADTHFPCNLWDAGSYALTLSRFEWEKSTNILIYGQQDIEYGSELKKPEFVEGNPTRLYHEEEVNQIMKDRNMKVSKMFGTFDGVPASSNEIQMMVISEKDK